MPTATAPKRRVPRPAGLYRHYVLSHRAVELLLEMAAGDKCHGRLISELIVAEWARREERAKLRQVVAQVLPEDET